MSTIDQIIALFQGPRLGSVRIEKIKPFQIANEVTTDTVWFENHNIEECIRATYKLGIEHIHLQTNTIDFLNDPRLKNVKGISMQFEIQNIAPLFNLKHLTHLGLPENVKDEFDFSKFKRLIFLGGSLPKKYTNLNQLVKLKFTHLANYQKSDLREFSFCKDLQKLWIYSADIESFSGISELSNLIQIDLTNCRKLTTLDGLSNHNVSLQTIHLGNCKKLKLASALKRLPNLKQLQIYQANELDSLSFLTSLHKLESLGVHPKRVGVRNNDYYPLVETLKKLNKLDNLKGWKPLNDYLDKKIIIEETEYKAKSELESIKENLGIMSWTEKREDGLAQYTKKNCKRAETIILDLIKQLERAEQNDALVKEDLIGDCIVKLNDFNNSLDGSFIETGEREELCDLFDNIADAVGLNVEDYPGGIADKWRDW